MSDTALLHKINAAVKAANEAEQNAEIARTELVSRSKEVGLLLLEAKKQHPKVKDFDAFLKRVDGLKLSRAYDYLALVGGRTTDAELKKTARERQQKKRDRDKRKSKAIPKPAAEPFRDVTEKSPVAGNDVDPVASAEQRKLAADPTANSARYLAEFEAACRAYLPKITVQKHRVRALDFAAAMLAVNTEEAA